MNVELLNEVADIIETTDRFDLRTYASRMGVSPWRIVPPKELWENCETAGCVCGWVNALTDGPDADDMSRAGLRLGLSVDQSWELFMPPEGHQAAHSVWQMDRPYRATAKQAAQVLREIASGKRTFACDAVRQP